MKSLSQLLLFGCLAFVGNAQNRPEYPKPPTVPVTDTFFGTVVEDRYRILEQDSLNVQEWVKRETDLSASLLTKTVERYRLQNQIVRNAYYSFGNLYRRGKYFFDRIRTKGTKAHLYIRKKPQDDPKEIVDPTDYNINFKDVVEIDDFEVSEDDRYLAFSLSHNGSDWREIRVKDIITLRDIGDEVTDVKFSDIVWSGNGFFYLRFERTKDDLLGPSIGSGIYYHTLKTSQADDRLIYGDTGSGNLSFKKIAAGNLLAITISTGVFHRNNKVLLVHLRDNFAIDTLIDMPASAKLSVVGEYGGGLLVHTDLNASRGRLMLFSEAGKNIASDFIPQYRDVLVSATLAGDKVVCTYLNDIDYSIVTFDTSATPAHVIKFPAGTSVTVTYADERDSVASFACRSFFHPPIVYNYNVNTFDYQCPERTRILHDDKDFVATKVHYTGKDGEQVPMILAHKKGLKPDSETPALLYGYGGYGSIITPFYDNGFMSFMQNEGIVAIPYVRGGGGLGTEWHKQGKGVRKETAVDDFISAAEYLISHVYTTGDKLTLMGTSHGGMLVAAAINKRPDICRVAIAERGVYDMLRYNLFTVGKASEAEFGNPAEEDAFNVLKAYSPLHNVKEADYPAVLVVTADNDDRAVPLHSYKYVAALQEKTTGTQPVLLLVEKHAGHNSSTEGLKTKIYSFIYDRIGMSKRKIHNGY